MQQALVEEHPAIDIAIIIVWIDMLAEDNADTAGVSTSIFKDKQVRQFHDPNRLFGKTVAKSLGAENASAWDMYLFYDKGMEWKEEMPIPLDWVHQLDDSWANPDHHAWGEALPARLREMTSKLIPK